MSNATRFSEAGLEALRAAARRDRPWEKSTGPRTADGKRRSSQNAWKRGYWGREEIVARQGARKLLDDLERQSDEVDVGFDVLDEWEERLVDELVAPFQL